MVIIANQASSHDFRLVLGEPTTTANTTIIIIMSFVWSIARSRYKTTLQWPP